MSFEAVAEPGPYCIGDPVIINFCNCPKDNLIAMRVVSPLPAPQLIYTIFDGGVQVEGVDVGSYQFEVVCCERLEQDFSNPYTQVYFTSAL